jgi:hypothetical protein
VIMAVKPTASTKLKAHRQLSGNNFDGSGTA